jgi:hypothetical protein
MLGFSSLLLEVRIISYLENQTSQAPNNKKASCIWIIHNLSGHHDHVSPNNYTG